MKAPQRAQRRQSYKKALADRERGYTITEVAEVMSHTLTEAIDMFNQSMAAKIPEEEAYKRPVFSLNIVPIMLQPEEYVATGIESRAVFTLELKQFGSSTVIFRDGMNFRNERDRKNVNAWLPGIWQRFFQFMMENAMYYSMALNPDNPEVKEEFTKGIEDLKAAKENAKGSDLDIDNINK